MYDRIKAFSEANNRSMSEIVETLCADYFTKQNESKAKLAEQHP